MPQCLLLTKYSVETAEKLRLYDAMQCNTQIIFFGIKSISSDDTIEGKEESCSVKTRLRS